MLKKIISASVVIDGSFKGLKIPEPKAIIVNGNVFLGPDANEDHNPIEDKAFSAIANLQALNMVKQIVANPNLLKSNIGQKNLNGKYAIKFLFRGETSADHDTIVAILKELNKDFSFTLIDVFGDSANKLNTDDINRFAGRPKNATLISWSRTSDSHYQPHGGYHGEAEYAGSTYHYSIKSYNLNDLNSKPEILVDETFGDGLLNVKVDNFRKIESNKTGLSDETPNTNNRNAKIVLGMTKTIIITLEE